MDYLSRVISIESIEIASESDPESLANNALDILFNRDEDFIFGPITVTVGLRFGMAQDALDAMFDLIGFDSKEENGVAISCTFDQFHGVGLTFMKPISCAFEVAMGFESSWSTSFSLGDVLEVEECSTTVSLDMEFSATVSNFSGGPDYEWSITPSVEFVLYGNLVIPDMETADFTVDARAKLGVEFSTDMKKGGPFFQLMGNMKARDPIGYFNPTAEFDIDLIRMYEGSLAVNLDLDGATFMGQLDCQFVETKDLKGSLFFNPASPREIAFEMTDSRSGFPLGPLLEKLKVPSWMAQGFDYYVPFYLKDVKVKYAAEDTPEFEFKDRTIAIPEGFTLDGTLSFLGIFDAKTSYTLEYDSSSPHYMAFEGSVQFNAKDALNRLVDTLNGVLEELTSETLEVLNLARDTAKADEKMKDSSFYMYDCYTAGYVNALALPSNRRLAVFVDCTKKKASETAKKFSQASAASTL